jgi:hypothetical protein
MGGDLDGKASVPYFKCVPCKIRVPASGAQTALTDGSCPSCGSALEPVSKLTEVLEFRSPNLFDPSVPPRVAERVADISGGRPVAEAQAAIARAVALDLLPPS